METSNGEFTAGKETSIVDLELLRVRGRHTRAEISDHQHQIQPIHVYPEFRPAPPDRSAAGKRVVRELAANYLRIVTKGGVEGLYGPIDEEAAIVVDRQLREVLIGRNALAGAKLWDLMYRSNRHARSGHFMMGISAVDNALWDLRGRYFGVPVYRLLGGPTRDRIPIYASCLGYSVEPSAAAERASELWSRGFHSQKWFMAYGPADGRDGLEKNLALAGALREGLGETAEIMFDAYSGWDSSYALAWARRAEQFTPRWLEEPVRSDNLEGFLRLSRATSIPIAAGEHLYGRWQVHEFLKAGALSVVQTDPEWCGGVSELERICTLASLYDAQVIPHGHELHAALHVVASQPPTTCPLGEYLIIKMTDNYFFEQKPPVVREGHIELSERPGFGIELDKTKIEEQRLVTYR